MLIKTSASFVKEFIDSLDETLQKLKPNAKLTATQKTWLGFCLMGILMLNAVNWAKFMSSSHAPAWEFIPDAPASTPFNHLSNTLNYTILIIFLIICFKIKGMGRSRYKIYNPQQPHFLTCTIVNWIPIFTRPVTVIILLDSFQYLQKQHQLKLYGFRKPYSLVGSK